MEADEMAGRVSILGVFVADVTFRSSRMPRPGETVIGNSVAIGPGGKGSNQAVAAARVGGAASFITKIGRDAFGDIARQLYREEGIDAGGVFESDSDATGVAGIMVDETTGENAIIIVPGASATLTTGDIDRAGDKITGADVFVTQLELPVTLAEHALALARRAQVVTVLNPAPAVTVTDATLALADYLTPNAVEASILSGIEIRSIEDARRAAAVLVRRGPANVLITLATDGILVKTPTQEVHVPAVPAARVVDTTGAGDAFVGAFAVALAEGCDIVEAVRFGAATASLKVTKPGTAWAMPRRAEVECAMAGYYGSAAAST
jgi:ribokinase